jgi:hypothetical protein
MEINAKDLSNGLYEQFIKKAGDGTIDASDLSELVEIAEKNGINQSEAKFLVSLTEKNGVELLKKQEGKALKVLQISELRTDYHGDPGFLDRWGNKELEKEIENRESLNFSEIDNLFISSFKKLDPESRSQLLELLNDGETFGKIAGSHLKALAVKGTLMKQDMAGKTVLDNLYRLYKGPALAGDSEKTYKKDYRISRELARDAVSALLSTACITQGAHYTCGAASLENYLQINNPGELVRIVRELAMKGEASLKDGKQMNAPQYSLNFKAGDRFAGNNKDGHNTEDRSRFDIIFQSAVMDEIALMGGDRNPRTPEFFDPASYNVKMDVDGQQLYGNGGAHWLAIRNLVRSITLKEPETHGINELSFALDKKTADVSPETTEKLTDFFRKNPGKQAIILYHTPGETSQAGAHYVLATGIFTGKDGREYISVLNTMANTGKDGYKSPGKDSRPYCQAQSKPVSELKKSLTAVVLLP